jgi:hypothetical protein
MKGYRVSTSPTSPPSATSAERPPSKWSWRCAVVVPRETSVSASPYGCSISSVRACTAYRTRLVRPVERAVDDAELDAERLELCSERQSRRARANDQDGECRLAHAEESIGEARVVKRAERRDVATTILRPADVGDHDAVAVGILEGDAVLIPVRVA